MSTLVVSSTLLEVAPIVEREVGVLGEGRGRAGALFKGKRTDFLITGVGPVPCAVYLTRILATGAYQRVVQAGIAGSFVHDIPIKSVVVVTEEGFGDLGSEDHGSYLDLFDMGLLLKHEEPFVNGFLPAPVISLKCLKGLPRVRSVTVNRVLSEAESVAWIVDRYNPQVVNMEGAAFFYTALTFKLPFLAVRAISDMVGPRDKSAWRIPEAVHALDVVLEQVLEEW